jgi:hypothetical protein
MVIIFSSSSRDVENVENSAMLCIFALKTPKFCVLRGKLFNMAVLKTEIGKM